MAEAKEEQQKVVRQVEQFNTVEMGLAQAKMTTEEARLAQLDAKARDNAQAILDMKSREAGMIRRVAKEQWIKTSFWMPENSEVELKQDPTQAAS